MEVPGGNPGTDETERPSAGAVRQTLKQIAASPLFSPSDRLCRFLEYITEETLRGSAERIKEYTIGVDVYGRGTDFDPRADAIVRVEAGRLRAKLAKFYKDAVIDVPVRIELPRGTYVPEFSTIHAAGLSSPPAASARRRLRWLVPALAALILVVTVAFLARFGRSRPAPQLVIAVLPFVSIGGPETNRVATGMVEQLTTTLAAEAGFLIPGRAESDRFAGSVDLAKVAAQLKAQAVLEGSVQPAGEGVRVTVQLVSTSDGFHVWSQTLESLPGRLQEFQERASNLITRTLRARLGNARQALRQQLTSNADALALYVKGNEAWETQRPPGLHQSVEFFRAAIEKDPQFAKAYEGMAASELYLADFEREIAADHVARAKRAALAALRLDDHLDDAHARLGNILFRREWNFAEGEQHLKRALTLAPGSAPPTRWYSQLARLHNAFSDAQEELEYGIMANPRSELLLSELGLLHYQTGRYEEAERQARRAAEVNPNFPLTLDLAGLLNEQAGRTDAALVNFRACAAMGELHRYCLAGLGHLLAHLGHSEEAEQIARSLEEANPPSPRWAAVVYAGLKDRERTLAALERAYQVHDLELPFSLLDPRLYFLKNDPRFRAVTERLKLSVY